MASTFAEQINELAGRIGAECKLLHTQIGDITQLQTTDKTSTVAAVNEIKSTIGSVQTNLTQLSEKLSTAEGKIDTNSNNYKTLSGSLTTLQETVNNLKETVDSIGESGSGGALIDDTTPSDSKVYSSQKTETLLTTLKNDLLGGAGTAYDTLKELADLIQANGSSIETLETLAAGHVKFDAAQSLGSVQQQQARSNINAASQTDLTNLQTKVTSNTEKLGQVEQTVNTLKTSVGDTTTDFVNAFEEALNGTGETV